MKTSAPEAARRRFRPSFTWLCFGLNLCLATGLTALVLIGPFWPEAPANPTGWSRLLQLFGQDAAVRRTALAAAVGLVVTACVFFRAPLAARAVAPRPVRVHALPSNVVGA